MPNRVSIDAELCDNTQACVAVCPMDVFALEDGRAVVANVSECSLCMKCIDNCPEGAIEVE